MAARVFDHSAEIKNRGVLRPFHNRGFEGKLILVDLEQQGWEQVCVRHCDSSVEEDSVAVKRYSRSSCLASEVTASMVDISFKQSGMLTSGVACNGFVSQKARKAWQISRS